MPLSGAIFGKLLWDMTKLKKDDTFCVNVVVVVFVIQLLLLPSFRAVALMSVLFYCCFSAQFNPYLYVRNGFKVGSVDFKNLPRKINKTRLRKI